jgi:hypothetical protein
MNKKNLVIYLTIFSLVILSSTISALNTSSTISQEDLTKISTITTTAADPKNWGEILASWKEGILNNPFIEAIDLFLTKINVLFLILFGVNYSWSLFMFFVIYFWVFLLIRIIKALNMTSIFSKGISTLIAIGLTLILAQIGLYSAISQGVVALIHKPEKPWLGFLVFILIIIATIFLSIVEKLVEEKLKKNRESLEKEKERLNRNVLDTYVSGIKKGME